ncbi:unnamed protein product [Heligmosomoides polygyrus]|uniref:Uncharacterized protein n=1 Tax=Heligmosomoides polygyrus TaxID=6339 RepID=A0A183GQD4_HELPZ|nr:unnamed protein product [Heligmosomoides polygyrus]
MQLTHQCTRRRERSRVRTKSSTSCLSGCLTSRTSCIPKAIHFCSAEAHVPRRKTTYERLKEEVW